MPPPSNPTPAVTATDPSPLDRSRVTVVLPTYNRRESLCRCLRAVLACDTDSIEVELRILDDGSTDGTGDAVAAILRDYAGPIRVRYECQANQGAAAARNAALRDADTDLILFIDDDCEPEPHWIRGLVEAPWAPNVGAIAGAIHSSDSGTWVSRYCRFIRFNEFPPHEDLAPGAEVNFVNTANCAYRRQALLEVGGFVTIVRGGAAGEDHHLARSVLRRGYRMLYEPRARVEHYHRETAALLTRTFWIRGYASTLVEILWREQPVPTSGTLPREYLRLLVDVLALLLFPRRVLKMRRHAATWRDACGFAYLDWARRVARRRGRITMLKEILSGRQTLEHQIPADA